MAIRKETDGWRIDFSGEKPGTPLLDTINHPIHMKNLSKKVTKSIHTRNLRFRFHLHICFGQDLEQLAAELRAEIVYTVAKTGGHLSSSLGVVELTVALHHVFNTPDDKLIWDVGHQVIKSRV